MICKLVFIDIKMLVSYLIKNIVNILKIQHNYYDDVTFMWQKQLKTIVSRVYRAWNILDINNYRVNNFQWY